MSAKQETNMEKLNRHRADLARCYATRDKVNQEENQEYLQIVHSANISLDDLRILMQGRKQEASLTSLPVVNTNMKETEENEDENE